MNAKKSQEFCFIWANIFFLKPYSDARLANLNLPLIDCQIIIFFNLVLVGIVFNEISINFLSAGTYNCGSGLNLPIVLLLSWCKLNETVNTFQIICICILIPGTAGIAIYGN